MRTLVSAGSAPRAVPARVRGQSQFSAPLAAMAAEREALRELQAWVVAHPREDLSVPALAERVHMSPRNFARAFAGSRGSRPAPTSSRCASSARGWRWRRRGRASRPFARRAVVAWRRHCAVTRGGRACLRVDTAVPLCVDDATARRVTGGRRGVRGLSRTLGAWGTRNGVVPGERLVYGGA